MQDGESHLYDEQGRFRFLGKKLGICTLCREKDYTYGVGAMGPSFRFCKRCIKKNDPRELRRDSNIALQRTANLVDHTKRELAEMTKRYKARFGSDAVIAWDLPRVMENRKVR